MCAAIRRGALLSAMRKARAPLFVPLQPLPEDADYCVVGRRADALGARGRLWALALAAGVSLSLALTFVAAGAWPVLPWSLVEIGGLALAFAWYERRAHDWERLTVLGDRVVVERVRSGRLTRREWNRQWLRVSTAPARDGSGLRVLLQGAGEACEFGSLLADDARREVGRELRRLTRR
jgi:uncharacterized membrane protein